MICRADLRPLTGAERRRTLCPFTDTAQAVSDCTLGVEQATMLLDLKGRIAFCDEAGAWLFHGCVADLLGKRIDSLIADLPLDPSTPGYNLAYVDFSFSNERWQRHRGLSLDGRAFPLELSLTAVLFGTRHAFLLHLRRPRDLSALAQMQRLASRNADDEALPRDVAARSGQGMNYDRLTGLPTAPLFLDRLHQALAQAARRECGFCLVDLRLDEFKRVEIRHGAPGVEQVLRALAQRLRQCVREEDTLARLGPDEFGIILLDLAQRANAEKVLDKLCHALHRDIAIENERLSLSASIGACLFPRDGEDELSLLKRVEHAMLDAKAAGGGCYRFSSASGAAHGGSALEDKVLGVVTAGGARGAGG